VSDLGIQNRKHKKTLVSTTLFPILSDPEVHFPKHILIYIWLTLFQRSIHVFAHVKILFLFC
jgi:hypothetical protein